MSDLPERIGKYEIVSLVARGGMGAVYKAIHPALKRHVIIKKLAARGNTPVVERFRREAQILMDLNDPRIVHIYDYFQEGSSHYLALEYVDGLSLDRILAERGRLPCEIAFTIVLDVALALKYAHDRGIVHRDVKPGNILVSRKGEVKLADFGIAATGIAKAEETARDDGTWVLARPGKGTSRERDLTEDGSTLGTPAYMPKEQILDPASVDRRADIYALGVVLYELVTGGKPFSGETPEETMARARRGRYARPRKLDPSLPREVDRLVRKTVRADPRRRYRDLAPAIRTLRRYLSKYPKREARKAIAQCVAGNEGADLAIQPRKRRFAHFVAVALAVLALAAATRLAWDRGLFQRYALSRWYAPVIVSLSVPSDAPEGNAIQARARIVRFGTGEGPDGAATSGISGILRSGVSPSSLVARPVFLRPGRYRLTLEAGSRVWVEPFEVARDPVSIRLSALEPSPRAAFVDVRALDAVTGEDITVRAKITTRSGGSWSPLSRGSGELALSGDLVELRAEAAGYADETLAVRLSWYQDRLTVVSRLKPLGR
jgi:serine/threonine-protein kinase